LAIVKRIMEQHNGDLRLEDRTDTQSDAVPGPSNSRGARVSLVLRVKSESTEADNDRAPASAALVDG
jgi:nitrogen fixation/metabolism regulation signal transduction histidine kinase